MFCSQCGHTLADQTPFCTQCGARQKTPSASSTPPPEPVAQAPRPAPPPAQPHPGYASPPLQPAPAQVHVHAHAPAPHPGVAAAANGLCPPLTTGQFFGMFLLMCVPLLGFILLLVWAFGGGNPNRRNYARAMLLMQVIACVLLVAGSVIAFLAQRAG